MSYNRVSARWLGHPEGGRGICRAAWFLCLLAVTSLGFAGTVDRVVAKLNEDIVTESDLVQAASDQSQEVAKQSYSSALKGEIIRECFDRQLLIQSAKKFSSKMPDDDLKQQTEDTIATIRSRFPNQEEFLKELSQQGTSLKQFKADIYKRISDDFKIYQIVTLRFKLTEADVKRFEQESLAKGEHPVSLRLRQLGVKVQGSGKGAQQKALDKVRELLVKINTAGTAFADGVRKYSEIPGAQLDAGDLGYLSASKLSGQVLAVTEKLEPGQASTPIITGDYASVFYVEEKRSARSVLFAKRFAEERTALVRDLRRRAQLQVFDSQLLKALPEEYRACVGRSAGMIADPTPVAHSASSPKSGSQEDPSPALHYLFAPPKPTSAADSEKTPK